MLRARENGGAAAGTGVAGAEQGRSSGAGAAARGTAGFRKGLVLRGLGFAAAAYLSLSCGVTSYSRRWEGLGELNAAEA